MTVTTDWNAVMNLGAMPVSIYVVQKPHDVLETLTLALDSGAPFVQFTAAQAHPDGIEDNIAVPVWVDPKAVCSIHPKPAEHS